MRRVVAADVHWGRGSQCSVFVSQSFTGQLQRAVLPGGGGDDGGDGDGNSEVGSPASRVRHAAFVDVRARGPAPASERAR